MPDEPRLRVLLVAPLPPPAGGISTWTRQLLAYADTHAVLDIVHVDTAVRWRHMSNTSLPLRLVGGALQALRDTTRVLWALLRKPRPVTMHVTTSAGPATVRDIAMLWLARRFGVKGIIHYRIGTLPATIARNGFAWGLTRTAMRTAAVVLPLGERTVQHVLAELPDLRCLSIPNPIALATVDHMLAALPSAQAEVPALRVVYVGHVTPAKGIRELVGACLRIADSRLTLDLVGVILPKFREEMERLAAERDGGRWLRLHGEVDRMAAVGQMARADILVLPSLTEAFPNVLLEAMACGRPIIATTVGAIEEMLDWDAPQPCGVCVPPGDEGALREAIEQLASDPERRAELGRRAREKAERCYALDVVFPQYVRLWRP